jgi:hypothetical protein
MKDKEVKLKLPWFILNLLMLITVQKFMNDKKSIICTQTWLIYNSFKNHQTFNKFKLDLRILKWRVCLCNFNLMDVSLQKQESRLHSVFSKFKRDNSHRIITKFDSNLCILWCICTCNFNLMHKLESGNWFFFKRDKSVKNH